MKNVGSIEQFRAWQRRVKHAAAEPRKVLALCGTGCAAVGSIEVAAALEDEIRRRGLSDTVTVKRTGCHGFCEQGPIVVVRPDGLFYARVEPDDAAEIIDRTVLKGEVIERLLFIDPATEQRIEREQDVPFYASQTRVVLRYNGMVDPLVIEDYIALDGYSGMVTVLETMTPEQVVDEVREAGLRGRGGAGFPTGVKWGFCRNAPGREKYLVCNADEGLPGAFMDRTLIEGVPHAVIEGMIIAGYAIGASHGIIYVRTEYPIAVRHAAMAVQQARDAGLLGKNILGSGFDFDITVREGAGAYVCGEETALIASLEGERGSARSRPPFPAQQGYRDKPTNINNVETLANVPLIMLKGKDWYRSIGTQGSTGTKLFALVGKVNNAGLIEVPMGATLREIVFDIGGGIPNGREFKAVQIGGPSGGCVPARFLDFRIDYDSVKELCGVMVAGGIIVLDDTSCIVDMARFLAEFLQKESCGNCVTCRVGTKQTVDILTRICAGRGQQGDIELLEGLAASMKSASLCGLGQSALNPVLSTLEYFRDEYEEHIRDRYCRAGACKMPDARSMACENQSQE